MKSLWSVSLQPSDNMVSLLANGSETFKWKVQSHLIILKGLRQRRLTIEIRRLVRISFVFFSNKAVKYKTNIWFFFSVLMETPDEFGVYVDLNESIHHGGMI